MSASEDDSHPHDGLFPGTLQNQTMDRADHAITVKGVAAQVYIRLIEYGVSIIDMGNDDLSHVATYSIANLSNKSRKPDNLTKAYSWQNTLSVIELVLDRPFVSSLLFFPSRLVEVSVGSSMRSQRHYPGGMQVPSACAESYRQLLKVTGRLG